MLLLIENTDKLTINPILPGFFGPCILQGDVKLLPCYKSSLANALVIKLSQIVDQVKWGLLVYTLFP